MGAKAEFREDGWNEQGVEYNLVEHSADRAIILSSERKGS